MGAISDIIKRAAGSEERIEDIESYDWIDAIINGDISKVQEAAYNPDSDSDEWVAEDSGQLWRAADSSDQESTYDSSDSIAEIIANLLLWVIEVGICLAAPAVAAIALL